MTEKKFYTEYYFQNSRNTNYSNTEIQNTKIPKYKLNIYKIQIPEIQNCQSEKCKKKTIKEIQKYKLLKCIIKNHRITEMQVNNPACEQHLTLLYACDSGELIQYHEFKSTPLLMSKP